MLPSVTPAENVFVCRLAFLFEVVMYCVVLCMYMLTCTYIDVWRGIDMWCCQFYLGRSGVFVRCFVFSRGVYIYTNILYVFPCWL